MLCYIRLTGAAGGRPSVVEKRQKSRIAEKEEERVAMAKEANRVAAKEAKIKQKRMEKVFGPLLKAIESCNSTREVEKIESAIKKALEEDKNLSANPQGQDFACF